MITKLYGQNIKKFTGVQELTGRDIFIGKNGAGKTTRLQILGLSMLGYVPGNGKTSAETHKLATGSEMSAGIEVNGFTFNRSFKKTSKESKTGQVEVKISQDIEIKPSKGERTNAEKEARILSEIGSFPVMLDFNEFLGISDSKRREFFYRLSPISSDTWTRSKVQSYLEAELLSAELREANQDRYDAMVNCIKEAMTSFPENYEISDGLIAMSAAVTQKLSYWKEEKSKAEGAVKKLTDIKNQMEETDRGIASNKQELETVRKKLQDLSAQIAGDTEKKKANDEKSRRLLDLMGEKEIWVNKTNPDDVASLQEKLDYEIQHELVPTDFEAARKQIDDNIHFIKEDTAAANEDMAASMKLVVAAEQSMKALQDALDNINQMVEIQRQKRESAIAAGKDPEDVKITGRCIINPMIGCDKDFSNFVTYAESKISEYKETIALNNSDVEKYKALVKDGETALAMQNDEKASINKKEMDEKLAIKDWESRVAILKSRIASGSSFEQVKAESISKIQSQYDALNSVPLQAIGDITMMEEQKKGYEARNEVLKKLISEQERAKTNLSNLQSTVIDDKVAGYNVDAYKLIQDGIGPKGVQGEIVKSILNPIRDDVQNKLAELGITEQFYFSTESDTGKEIFQFGITSTAKGDRNFDALSQGEKVMLLMALIITIIERSNPPVKILVIDNVENLDSHNFENAIGALNKIGQNLDNIILAGVVDIDEAEGFKVWRLGERS